MYIPLYSLDGGVAWHSFPAWPWPSNGTGEEALHIAVAPRVLPGAPVRFLVANGRTVYRTGDYGLTWAQETFGHLPDCYGYFSAGFVSSHLDPERLFLTQGCNYCDWIPVCGTYYAVRASTDAGMNWTLLRMYSDSPTPSPVVASRVYVRATYHPGEWYRTDDDGATWELETFPVDDLALDAEDPQRMYGLDGDVGRRSIDGGASWAPWGVQPCPAYSQLLADPSSANTLFVRCDDGLFRSRSGGDSWQPLAPRGEALLAVDFGTPGRLYWAKFDGLWRSRNEGTTWKHLTFDYVSVPPRGPWMRYLAPVGSSYSGNLRSLEVISPTVSWAGGSWNGTILRWDGHTWSPVDNPSVSFSTISDIDAVSANEAWAVSYFMDAPFMAGSDILHWNGTSWTTSFSTDPYLQSIAMASGDDGWAMGSGGSIFRWNGSDWTSTDTPTGESLYSISLVSADDGWAVGSQGTIIRWDGTDWTSSTSPVGARLRSVDMLTASDGWAVGDEGTVVRWNGADWSQFPSPTGSSLFSVDLISTDEGWAVGDGGTILHWDGNAWAQVASPTDEPLYAVAMLSAESGWIASDYGVMLVKASPVFLPQVVR
jgi:photosystem II stability/assembly factor-like uncharacterized protein